MRIQCGRIPAGVILRRGARVRYVKEATRDSASQVKSYTVVVRYAIILSIVNRAKTRIESRRSGVGWLPDQVARQDIDVHAIRNLTSCVAEPNKVGGVRSTIKHGGNKVATNSVFEGGRINECGRRSYFRVDSPDRQASARNSSRSVQTGSGRTQGCACQLRELEPKRGLATATLDKNRSVGRCIPREKRRPD